MITYGGISVLNAIPNGIGAVIPINLYFKSTISLSCKMDEKDYKIIREVFGDLVDNLGFKKESNIPIGVGLKSSSAYTSALIWEYSKFKGFKYTEEKIARLSSEVSKKLNLSYTGAFDDALSSVTSNFVVTDNNSKNILISKKIAIMNIIIAIPPLERPKDIENRLKKSDFSEATYFTLKGKLREAAIINGYSIAKALGYPEEPLNILKDLGAKMFGYSGNGPAIFAEVDRDNEAKIRNFMTKLGKIIETKTRGE